MFIIKNTWKSFQIFDCWIHDQLSVTFMYGILFCVVLMCRIFPGSSLFFSWAFTKKNRFGSLFDTIYGYRRPYNPELPWTHLLFLTWRSWNSVVLTLRQTPWSWSSHCCYIHHIDWTHILNFFLFDDHNLSSLHGSVLGASIRMSNISSSQF